LLTEWSHLRAACQGIEEVKKHKTGKSHCCGSRSYATFWILKAHVKVQGLVKPYKNMSIQQTNDMSSVNSKGTKTKAINLVLTIINSINFSLLIFEFTILSTMF